MFISLSDPSSPSLPATSPHQPPKKGIRTSRQDIRTRRPASASCLCFSLPSTRLGGHQSRCILPTRDSEQMGYLSTLTHVHIWVFDAGFLLAYLQPPQKPSPLSFRPTPRGRPKNDLVSCQHHALSQELALNPQILSSLPPFPPRPPSGV